jgi:hypothetical protein
VYAGASAASSSYSTFIGPYAGWRVSGSSYSTFIGYNTGFNSTLGNNNIIVGTNVTLASGSSNSINIGGLIFGSGSYNNTGSVSSGSANGFIGINQPNPQFNLDVSGSARITGNTHISGTIFLPNNGQILGATGYVTIPTVGLYVQGGRLQMSNDIAILNKAQTNFVTFAQRSATGPEAVYNLSNVGNVSMSGSITLTSASLDYQQNTSVATGSFQTVVSAATGSFRCAFFDYVAFSGSIVRAGTVVTTWSGSATEFYENYTADLGGSTSVVTLQTAISGSNIQLQAGISGSAWSVRSLVRLL